MFINQEPSLAPDPSILLRVALWVQHNWDAVKHIARHHWGTKSCSSGVNQAGGCAVGCVMRNRHCIWLAAVPIPRPSSTQGMWSWKHPQVLPLPQMSREIKMPPPQRQSCAVFRQADLGGILGVENIFQVAWAVACALVSKLLGKHLPRSSVLVFLPITFWGLFTVLCFI